MTGFDLCLDNSSLPVINSDRDLLFDLGKTSCLNVPKKVSASGIRLRSFSQKILDIYPESHLGSGSFSHVIAGKLRSDASDDHAKANGFWINVAVKIITRNHRKENLQTYLEEKSLFEKGNGENALEDDLSSSGNIEISDVGAEFDSDSFADKIDLSSEKMQSDSSVLVPEIKILKKLDHPNILGFMGEYHGKLCSLLITELLMSNRMIGDDSSKTGPGVSKELFDILNEERSGFGIGISMARIIMKQLIGAVRYLHEEAHVCHRDIKLENIIVTKTPRHSHTHDYQDLIALDGFSYTVKLIDFGLAMDFDGLDSCGNPPLLERKCGSVEYIPPEVLLNQPYNGFGVDIWACGVVLYAMVFGELPFEPVSGYSISSRLAQKTNQNIHSNEQLSENFDTKLTRNNSIHIESPSSKLPAKSENGIPPSRAHQTMSGSTRPKSSYSDMYKRICLGKFFLPEANSHHPLYSVLTEEFKSLIRGMLSPVFQRRLNASAVLEHPWLCL